MVASISWGWSGGTSRVKLQVVVGLYILAAVSATSSSSTEMSYSIRLRQQQGQGSDGHTTIKAREGNDHSTFPSMFRSANRWSPPEGQKLVEGDIMVWDSLEGRKAVGNASLYWPTGEVPFTYHDSIKVHEQATIERAMKYWEQHTCVSFWPRRPSDEAFLLFRSDLGQCWSWLGRNLDAGARRGQNVSIGQGCARLNVVVHEIGHAIGFYHEQSRSDRDQHIHILIDNVAPTEENLAQFEVANDTNLDTPYDLTSVMHYDQWAFSKDKHEKRTIVARNPAHQRFLTGSHLLSFRDRLLANRIYQCATACDYSAAGPCLNGGYLTTTTMRARDPSADQCACDCPPNFTGANCEIKIRSDYYEELPCGGILKSEGRISTPGYPNRTLPNQSCMWDIRAPRGKQVRIRFHDFQFAARSREINKCVNESVEIRLNDECDSKNYCGIDIAGGEEMMSTGSRALIIIQADNKMVGRGLSAEISFVEGQISGIDQDDKYKQGRSCGGDYIEDEDNDIPDFEKPKEQHAEVASISSLASKKTTSFY